MTKLVCLPFAGAGASFYRSWSTIIDHQLELVPLQLPGRERLIDEEPFRDAQVAADRLLADLLAELGGPATVAVFGHSLGAVLAYELAHRLSAVPEVDLVRLFVSGSQEPNAQRDQRATGLTDDAFVSRVEEFAGFSHAALRDPEMRELILPTLRADVEMHENYVPSTGEPLAVPITSIRGRTDALVSSDEAAAWAKATGRDFEFAELPGGHMYLVDAAPALLRLIDRSIH